MTGSVGGVPSGARGEYGDLIPIRPGVEKPVVCLRGHRLDLYGMLRTYNQRYRLHATLCETCRAQEGCDQQARRLAEWAHVDVTKQHASAAAPDEGLVLVAHPPVAGTLTGRVELRLDGRTAGAATLTYCIPCRTAILDYVQVSAEYRRLGYGRTLVAAALTRAPSYAWSAPLPGGAVAQAFRARIALPRPGAPCVHRAG